MSSKTSTKKRSSSPTNAEPAVADKKKTKADFLSMMNKTNEFKPTKILKNGSSNGQSVDLECVLLSATHVTKTIGAKSVPKTDLVAVTCRVRTNGTNFVVNTGIPGCGYLLPTQTQAANGTSADAEDGPEAAIAKRQEQGGNSAQKKEAVPRNLAVTPTCKTIPTFFVRTSVYAKPPNAGNGADKQNETSNSDPDVENFRPGSRVMITGNVANLAPDGSLWLNSSRVTLLGPEIAPCDEVQSIIHEFMKNEIALPSALFASGTANGFFGVQFSAQEGERDARDDQAATFRQLWAAYLGSVSNSVASIAANVRASSTNDDANAKALDEHVSRLEKVNCADVASGASSVFLPSHPSAAPFYAALVQSNKMVGVPYTESVMRMWENSDTSDVPRTFCGLNVSQVKIDSGALIEVLCTLDFVADKEMAIRSFAENKNPVITSNYAALGLKLSARVLASSIGTNEVGKLKMAIEQLLKYVDMAVVVEITANEFNTNGVECKFPAFSRFDWLKAIKTIAFKVSPDFIKKHLCGDTEQYVHDENDAEKIKDKTKLADLHVVLPHLKDGYQPISETPSFHFKKTKTPLDKPNKEFYVLAPGCLARMEEEGSFSIEDAEKEIVKKSEEEGKEGGDVFDYLTSKCIVYCVATA